MLLQGAMQCNISNIYGIVLRYIHGAIKANLSRNLCVPWLPHRIAQISEKESPFTSQASTPKDYCNSIRGWKIFWDINASQKCLEEQIHCHLPSYISKAYIKMWGVTFTGIFSLVFGFRCIEKLSMNIDASCWFCYRCLVRIGIHSVATKCSHSGQSEAYYR